MSVNVNQFRSLLQVLTVGLLLAVSPANADSPVKLENLFKSSLESSSDLEVIVSLVEIGPNVTLPKHYHPGEEFIYALEGSATLWLRDQPDVHLKAGQVAKVPLEQVHTAVTGDQPVKALVFRVHKKGQPERIPVE